MYLQDFDPLEFERTEIESIPVYWKNLPWSPCIHVYIVFNTGAFDDPKGKEGLSHFLEHMIFNGCPTLPNKKAINEWSKINALNTWNAWTGHYSTAYHLKTLPEKFNSTIDGMKDMIFHPHLLPKDVEHERSVITQEAWGRYQNAKYLKYSKEIIDNLFHGHEHARIDSPLGWPETIATISHKDITKWHKEKYVKNNFYIVLCGAVTPEHVSKLEIFAQNIRTNDSLKHHKKGIIGKPKILKIIRRADEIGEIKEQVEISYLRITDGAKKEKIEIVSMFRRFMYDLMIERLRTEKALCYGIKIYGFMEKDYSQFTMSVSTDEKNIDTVEKEFRKVLNEIIEGKYENRFDILKKLGIDQVKSEENMSEGIINTAVRSVSRYNGVITPLKDRLKDMEKVTHKEVIDFIQETFDPKYTFTEIILPSKK